MLTPKERETEFPVHIDLGKKESAMGGSLAMQANPSGKKGKPRTVYPTAYIDNVPGLEALPKEGCMLVEFRRTRLNIDTPENGEDTAGVTIELRRICLPEGEDMEDEYGPKTLARAFDGKTESEEETDDEEEV